MWSRLSIWVMAPAQAYRVDDRPGWTVFVADGEEQPFTWKGIGYTAGLPAGVPGYVDCEAPPGTYVVWAERVDAGVTTRTHKAVVAVHDEPVVTVRLLPDAPRPEQPEPDPGCEVHVEAVTGERVGDAGRPGRLVVTGTASGCPEVHVVVHRADGQRQVEGDTTVGPDGGWSWTVGNELEVRCGETVVVEVWCTKDRKCRARTKLDVHCEDRRH